MSEPAVSNPKVRTTGAVLVGLSVLAYVGTITGLDAHGTGGRVVLAVVGSFALIIGLALIRTRTPSVAALSADPAGLHVTVAGRPPALIEWPAIEAIWLRRLSVVFGGYLLLVRYAEGAPRMSALRPFERRGTDGASTIRIGLNRLQSDDLRRTVPEIAGDRYRAVSG